MDVHADICRRKRALLEASQNMESAKNTTRDAGMRKDARMLVDTCSTLVVSGGEGFIQLFESVVHMTVVYVCVCVYVCETDCEWIGCEGSKDEKLLCAENAIDG